MHNWKQERLRHDRTRSLLPHFVKGESTPHALAHERNTPARPILADSLRRMYEPGSTPDS
ncbi:MAG: hypothetical protein MUE40_02740 [Anaerolineae bacterium]|nr:hypothetical protein [Anaerolineae bacterium]